MLLPQTPTPRSDSQPSERTSSRNSAPATSQQIHQPKGACRRSTILPILRVSEASSSPGTMTRQVCSAAAKVSAARQSSRSRPEPGAPSVRAAEGWTPAVAGVTRKETRDNRSSPFAALPSRLGDRRVGVGETRLVGGARVRVQLFEESVIERRRLALSDHAVGIVEVAEGDRLGWAGGLAGRPDLAVADLAVLAIGLDFRFADALDAIGAFLHDAAAAHRQFGVPGEVEPRVALGEVEIIEAPHLVGAVVRAEPRADAAVVDHDVEAVVIVYGGI